MDRPLIQDDRLLPLMLTVLSTAAAAQGSPPQIFSPGVISGPANDLSPAFTPDGKTVFFTRSNSSQSTILVSHLSDRMRFAWLMTVLATLATVTSAAAFAQSRSTTLPEVKLNATPAVIGPAVISTSAKSSGQRYRPTIAPSCMSRPIICFGT